MRDIRPWTDDDLAFLRAHAWEGAAEIAKVLHRTERSVRDAAH